VLVVESNKALLWVHGTVDPVRPGPRPYYQGKSRIPAPLLVRRHYGSTDLAVTAREILGLSKMNWNSFDMYTKLPATIESSNRIARIGALLERAQPASYDYRLFI
jgi:argonaute-like protein implicated in RNA metabolism and viral defense